MTTHFDTYPGLEQFTADVDNYSVQDGNYFYFDLPFTPSLMPVGADRRALPLFMHDLPATTAIARAATELATELARGAA